MDEMFNLAWQIMCENEFLKTKISYSDFLLLLCEDGFRKGEAKNCCEFKIKPERLNDFLHHFQDCLTCQIWARQDNLFRQIEEMAEIQNAILHASKNEIIKISKEHQKLAKIIIENNNGFFPSNILKELDLTS